MSAIDHNGKLFGRFNLIDAAIVAFVLVLIPIGYATALLFRPERPVIDSVTSVDIGSEERRVSVGTILTAKLKVRGHGFNPLLRARIDSIDAVGLVYENPNSLDVIVGVVPPGKHDLVLYDGIQEVARAAGAVEIQVTTGPAVRLYGWFTDIPRETAEAIKTGTTSGETGTMRILALGPVQPARIRATMRSGVADLPLQGRTERAAEIVLNCDWPAIFVCSINGQRLNQPPPVNIGLPGGALFEVEEIAPPQDPIPATAQLRVESTRGMKAGDRDSTIGSRAAEVVSIDGNSVTLKLGVDESREGWRYRGELVMPGETLHFRTDSYAVAGTVTSVNVKQP